MDKRYDPGKSPLSCPRPNRLVKGNLPDFLEKMKYKPGALTVLKPLVLKKKKDLSENEEVNLTELLEYAILQKFPKLSLKEVKKMIELTPLDQTVAGRELIEIGIREGEKRGEKKGEIRGEIRGEKKGVRKGKLIGEILFAQRILKQKAYIRPRK